MKRSVFQGFIILIGILLIFPPPTHASRGLKLKRVEDLSHQSGKLGEYKALIIGINDYIDPDIPDLDTAVNDAKALTKLLREKYGFDVSLLLERKATKEAIYKALRKLASLSKPSDSILIYYAGHGDLDKTYNDGWWIPADAKSRNPVTYLDNTQVQKAMRSMKAKHVLLISDSCYSGTLFGKARILPAVIDDKYYLSLYNEKSRWGMTSGNKTPVSDQGTEGHSVFAYQLLKALRNNENPYITTQEIYTRIAPIISNNSAQTPLCRPILNVGDQGGEFVFVSRLSAAPLKDISKKEEQKKRSHLSQPKPVSISQENLFWESIKDSDNPDYFKAYLQKYPNGAFAPLAHLKVDELNTGTKKVKKKTLSTGDSKEIGRDGPYIAYDNGIVKDTRTGLEWVAGSDKDTTWEEAKTWAEGLDIGGGGWRMPTLEELRTLRQEQIVKGKMTPLLKTTGSWLWSGKTMGSSSAWAFNWYSGIEFWYDHNYSTKKRGFAVRLKK